MERYEYGAMSSRFEVRAENKLTAYVAMVAHYDTSAHLIVIYSPEESTEDQWLSFDGKVSVRLDEVFGGPGSFDQYVADNREAIQQAYSTIKRIV